MSYDVVVTSMTRGVSPLYRKVVSSPPRHNTNLIKRPRFVATDGNCDRDRTLYGSSALRQMTDTHNGSNTIPTVYFFQSTE